MLDVVCVLKTGNFKNRQLNISYNKHHVKWLKDQFERYLTVPHKFICLTDIADEIDFCETRPLISNLPGWWSKIELFRPNLFPNKTLYLDLDMVIVGNIDEFAEHPHKFTMLRDVNNPTKGIGSAIIAWEGDYSFIYNNFMKDPKRYIQEGSINNKNWGDQGFIASQNVVQEYWQELFPDKIHSYKKNLLDGKLLPKTKLVAFHGEPKPQDVDYEWIPPFPLGV